MFYRRVDQLQSAPAALRTVLKGAAHLWGLLRLVARVYTQRPDVVHFQWLVVPPLDLLAIRLINRRAPVVLTVHDTVPFNGDRLSQMQTGALDLALRACDALIVHTVEGRQRLIARGLDGDRIAVIPHGPLALQVPLPAAAAADPALRRFTLFGELKPYKGIDVLLGAVAALSPDVRRRARFVVAGRPRMDLAPIQRQIAALGLNDVVELRAHRLSEAEMADLFAATDCFLFPYRQIDASGVYYLTKALGKWMIASRVGIFAEDLADGRPRRAGGARGAGPAGRGHREGHRCAAAARRLRAGTGVAEHRGGDGAPLRDRPRAPRCRQPAGPRAARQPGRGGAE